MTTFSSIDSPDNIRYVSVRDLTGPNHMTTLLEIPAEWQETFIRAHSLFQTYPFSVVWIQDQSLGDAIEIFQRINQAGKRLSRYDLVCANLWTESFDFRKRVNLLNGRFKDTGFGALHETIYTQTFSLIIDNKCTTASELAMRTDDVLHVWQRAVRSLELAVSFAANTLGVKRADFLPYRGILAVLAYYFYHVPKPALSAREREGLWRWFWSVTLSERYSSTSPSRMAEDGQILRRLMQGHDVAFPYTSRASIDTVLRTRMTSTTSALRNAFLCMLALRQPRNLKDSSPVDLTDNFFSNLKKAERHHIFPVAHLKAKGFDASRVHQIANFCFIPADLNQEIGSQPPAQYLGKYRAENNHFQTAADSHLLPVEPDSAVWTDDYSKFLTDRSQRIADQLNRLVESTPDEFLKSVEGEEVQIAHSEEVGLMEIRMRDFIDDRLTAVIGKQYWKQTMPGDVIARAKNLIADWQKRHPYAEDLQFASGRRRLDFCDVSDYEKIFAKNWPQFEEFFQHKQTLQTHMAAYRTLRNCVQHNRTPSTVELKMGEAALTWLQGVLGKYDQTVNEYAESNGHNGFEDEIEEVVFA